MASLSTNPRPARAGRSRRAALAFASAVALIALTLVALAAAARTKPRRERPAALLLGARDTCSAFGAACVGEAEGRNRAFASSVLAAELDRVARLGERVDRARAESELAQLDAHADSAGVACSAELWDVLTAALAVARESDGAYDPTAAPVARAWANADGLRPDPAEVNRARALVGWTKLQLEPGTRTVRFPLAGMALDLDGVASGLALDRALDSLRAGGVRRARLTLGEVAAVFADEGPSWTVPVSDPRDPARTALAVIARRGAVATSGPAARTFDPRSGMPVLGDATVAVVAQSAARAQGLTRALRAMGREEAERFALSRRDIGVLWLEPYGSTLQVWRWGLLSVAADSAAVVRWME
jgi:FAD:protein FMN transferase